MQFPEVHWLGVTTVHGSPFSFVERQTPELQYGVGAEH